jgi:CheY-like chemotaxis protein
MDKYFEILLIEDNLGDVRIAIEAFKESKIPVNVNHVTDGIKAFDFLKKASEYKNKPTPDLILLDLNLPKISGFEILSKLKSNDDLKQIPIVIFTTSHTQEDIEKCYKLGANSFISKPIDLDSFIDTIRVIGNYWFHLVKLPNKS